MVENHQHPDIKIFVSNRIDLESTIINESPYVNVRCGAIFDHRADADMLGDNTGDNISNKRLSFCELTVQYWAWKNVKADYYGLCHYRRYLSFDNKQHIVSKTEHDNGCVNIGYLTDSIRDEYGLNYDSVKAAISQYDVIACEPISSTKSNLQAMKDSPDYHNINDLFEVVKIIHEKYPDMDNIVQEYLHSKKIRLYNCWVMKRDIFMRYSEWLFSILFELEKRIDMSSYGIQKYRTPGTIGERLFGIYCLYLSKQKDIRLKNQQLLFIEHPEAIKPLNPFWGNNQVTITSNFNNKYVYPFSVSLLSILNKVNERDKYEIIILSEDITLKNKNILKAIVNKYNNVHLSFYNPFYLLNDAKLFDTISVYSKDLFIRTIIPFALSNYNKVIVIDADTVVKRDLAELFNVDIKDCLMGAVRDVVYGGYLNGMVPGTMEYAKEVLRLKNPYDYCNTGVIVLNCKRIREEYRLKDIIKIIGKRKYRIYEQDILNMIFRENIFFLEENWNLFTYTNQTIKQCAEMAPLSEYLKYEEARKDPYVIHYAAHPKPWWANDADFGVEFWKIARESPFYEELAAQLYWNVANDLYEFKRHGGFSESFPRRVAGIFFPKGSKRREYLKIIFPKESRLYQWTRKIYYSLFHS